MKDQKPYEDPKPTETPDDKYGRKPEREKTPREIMMQKPPHKAMDIRNSADYPLEVGFDVVKAVACPACGAIGAEVGVGCPAQAPAVICPIRRNETARAMKGRPNVRVRGPSEPRMSLEDMRDAFVVRRSEEEEYDFKHGDRVKSWAGVGTISYIRGDKVKLNLEDGTRSKFLNMSGLKKV